MYQRTSTLKCGCPATWSDAEGCYIGECHCSEAQRRAARLAERQALRQQRAEEYRRGTAALLRRPFNVLR